MGIRSGINKDTLSLPMFSDDILKIEISSPDVSGQPAIMLMSNRIDQLMFEPLESPLDCDRCAWTFPGH